MARLEPMTVRAVYLTYYGVGDRGLRQNVLSLAERTEVNAVVIDVKGDRGKLTYRSAVPLAERDRGQRRADRPEHRRAAGQPEAAQHLHDRPDRRLQGRRAGPQRQGGRPGRGGQGSPRGPALDRRRGARLGRSAAARGLGSTTSIWRARRPTRGSTRSSSTTPASRSTRRAASRPARRATRGRGSPSSDRVKAIGGFLRRARDEVRLAGAFVSADVFGYVAWNDGDNGVGHDLDALAGAVDYLCPTVYPSSFRAGLPGLLAFRRSIQQPYAVVFESMRRARARTGRPRHRAAALAPVLRRLLVADRAGLPDRRDRRPAERRGGGRRAPAG